MARSGVARDFETGLKLSLSDLFHEWKLSSCLIFAIAGVIAPLLLLFGLKYGTFTALRLKLVEDPKNREIIPLSNIDYRRDWFQKVALRSDVAFLMPKTREIAVIIYVQLTGQAVARMDQASVNGLPRLDALPTGPGDVLLLENGMQIPGDGQCVLSRLAAETVGAKRGNRIKCTIDRRRENKIESVSFELEVIGVLPDRAGAGQTIFLPLSMVDAVETYRDGGGVPHYGWPGDVARVNPVFDGFTLLFENPLSRERRRSLTSGTGVSNIRQIPSQAAPGIIGLPLPEHLAAYLLYNQQVPVGFDSLNIVKKKLSGSHVILIPYVKPREVSVSGGPSGLETDITIAGYWANKWTLKTLGLHSLPAFEPVTPRPNAERFLKVVLPAHPGAARVGELLTVTVNEGTRRLTFPARVAARIEGLQMALVPAELMGVINMFIKRPKKEMLFDPASREFLFEAHDYVSFRMYARSIDDVEPLRRFLADQGIEALTKAYEIERVKSVDGGMTKIFWLVAMVGIAGCLATLVASFASSVERKKRDLGIMRLMGMSGWLIFQVPVSQAIFIGVSGFVTATAAYFTISTVINQIFGKNISTGSKMCQLEPLHFGIAFSGTLAVVTFSSLFAAWQATRIDPADALRDE